ncbi:MAG: winged helix-turn-helix domain-containing protein [Actinobacteria bacterium]|nr:winged helix-turn-helix domain-containing protein [Actinomycetota bacterium]
MSGEALVMSNLEGAEVIQVGDLQLYPDEFVAMLKGERLSLTPKEFQLLILFARNPGRLLRRNVISEAVWGTSAPGRTIDIHVARLRSQLPAGSIETVIRLGYRFLMA